MRCGPGYVTVRDRLYQRPRNWLQNRLVLCYNGRVIRCGEVVEWFKAAVLKTAVVVRLPWVRIPPSPPKTHDAKASRIIGKLFAWSRGVSLGCIGALLLREAAILFRPVRLPGRNA